MILGHKGKVIAIVLAALLMAWWLFYPSERDRLDAEAKRLCAIDGGVRVYETVKLPPEKFDQYGRLSVPSNEDKVGFGYYRKYEYWLLQGPIDPSYGPNLTKHKVSILRSNDKKIMGEDIYFQRAGGCPLEGYVQGCGFQCPSSDDQDLEAFIFSKEQSK